MLRPQRAGLILFFITATTVLRASPSLEFIAWGGGVRGEPGEEFVVRFTSTLRFLGDDPSHIQGWSIGVAPVKARITSITTAGTSVDFDLSAEFNRTELTSGPGNEGAVSVVVLEPGAAATLEPSSVVWLAGMETVIPIVPQAFRAGLRYVSFLQGSMGPVRTELAYAGGRRVEPDARDGLVEVETTRLCGEFGAFNVGFSPVPLSNGVPFEGVAGEPESPARIAVRVPEGTSARARVYVNIVSNNPGGHGIQGWSFSIEQDRREASLVTVTTAGTSVERYAHEGFVKAEVAMEDYEQGAVTAVALSLSEIRTLPPVGTESVLLLEFQTDPIRLSDGEREVASLRFVDGLTGRGQPVANVLVVDGSSSIPCNLGTTGLRLTLVPEPRRLFIRGNANGSRKVDLGDAIWILNELFASGAPSPCQDAADANDDGGIDLSDPIYLIRYLLLGGRSPPEPFAECGTDFQLDALECEEPAEACDD